MSGSSDFESEEEMVYLPEPEYPLGTREIFDRRRRTRTRTPPRKNRHKESECPNMVIYGGVLVAYLIYQWYSSTSISVSE